MITVISDLEGTQFDVRGMRLPMNRADAIDLCQQMLNSLTHSNEYHQKTLSVRRNYDHSAQPVLPAEHGRIGLHLVA